MDRFFQRIHSAHILRSQTSISQQAPRNILPFTVTATGVSQKCLIIQAIRSAMQ